MNIYVLKEYVEKCLAEGKEATFEGLKKYYSSRQYNKKYIDGFK